MQQYLEKVKTLVRSRPKTFLICLIILFVGLIASRELFQGADTVRVETNTTSSEDPTPTPSETPTPTEEVSPSPTVTPTPTPQSIVVITASPSATPTSNVPANDTEFDSSTNVTPSRFSAGKTTDIKVKVTCNECINTKKVKIKVEISNSKGDKVFTNDWDAEFEKGDTKTFTTKWDTPDSDGKGDYKVRTMVTSPNGNDIYFNDPNSSGITLTD